MINVLREITEKNNFSRCILLDTRYNSRGLHIGIAECETPSGDKKYVLIKDRDFDIFDSKTRASEIFDELLRE